MFRSKLARFTRCEQVMPIPMQLRDYKPCIPKPLYPLELPFEPKQEPYVPPKVVPIEIGTYPSSQPVLPGMILSNSTGFLPPGYLVCDGSQVSRQTYEILFNLIGTYYGDGDYHTTFNLPNLTNDCAPGTIYIIKYDLYSDSIPYIPPVPCGNPQPAPPTEIGLEMLVYPLNFVPPPGTILYNTTDTVPPGYLACTGAEISRDTYSVLYNTIGTYYGEGNQSTTFNLPNLATDNSPPYRYIIRYLNPLDSVSGNVIQELPPITGAPPFPGYPTGAGAYPTGAGAYPTNTCVPPTSPPFIPPYPPVPSVAPPSRTNIQILPYPLPYIPPPGTILHNTMNYLPDGYLACDGTAVSRTTYSLLYNLIGTYYGSGDGSTTFTLPRLSHTVSYEYIIRYQNPADGIVPNPMVQIPVFPMAYVPTPGSILRNTEMYVPSGYLPCDGSAISRTEYSILFGVVDTFYGAGDGSTTFNLPSLSVGTGSPSTYIVRFAEQIIPCVTITPNLNVAGVGLSGTESFNFN